jgi:hypothetical protein
LFTLYKIAGTINLCRQLKAKYPEVKLCSCVLDGKRRPRHGRARQHYGERHAFGLDSRGAWPCWAISDATILQTPLEELKKISANTAVLDLLEKTALAQSCYGRRVYAVVVKQFVCGVHGLVVVNQDNVAFQATFCGCDVGRYF